MYPAAWQRNLNIGDPAVLRQVLRDAGVQGNRLAAYGRGEDQPVASNLTPEGRAANRRVEIIIRPSA